MCVLMAHLRVANLSVKRVEKWWGRFTKQLGHRYRRQGSKVGKHRCHFLFSPRPLMQSTGNRNSKMLVNPLVLIQTFSKRILVDWPK